MSREKKSRTNLFWCTGGRTGNWKVAFFLSNEILRRTENTENENTCYFTSRPCWELGSGSIRRSPPSSLQFCLSTCNFGRMSRGVSIIRSLEVNHQERQRVRLRLGQRNTFENSSNDLRNCQMLHRNVQGRVCDTRYYSRPQSTR